MDDSFKPVIHSYCSISTKDKFVKKPIQSSSKDFVETAKEDDFKPVIKAYGSITSKEVVVKTSRAHSTVQTGKEPQKTVDLTDETITLSPELGPLKVPERSNRNGHNAPQNSVDLNDEIKILSPDLVPLKVPEGSNSSGHNKPEKSIDLNDETITLSPDFVPFKVPEESNLTRQIGNTKIFTVVTLDESPVIQNSKNCETSKGNTKIFTVVTLDESPAIQNPPNCETSKADTKEFTIVTLDESPAVQNPQNCKAFNTSLPITSNRIICDKDPLAVEITVLDSPPAIVIEDSPPLEIIMETNDIPTIPSTAAKDTTPMAPEVSVDSSAIPSTNGESDHPKEKRKVINPITLDATKTYAKENQLIALDLFEELTKLIEENEPDTKLSTKIILKLRERLKNAEKKYLYSKFFLETLNLCIHGIQRDKSKLYGFVRQTSDELKANAKPIVPPNNEENNVASNKDRPVDDDLDNDDELDDKTKANIRKLEKALKQISKKIIKLEESACWDSDDEYDEENSPYIREDRYKRRYMQIYSKICELRKRRIDLGTLTQSKIKFEGTDHPVINKTIEKYYNTHRQFPDYGDMLNLVQKVSDAELNLSSHSIQTVAEKAFTSFGEILKQRRMEDEYNIFISRLGTAEDPADQDEDLAKDLAENKKHWNKIDEVINKFVTLQEEKKNKPGGEENGEETVESDDDDDDEEGEEDKEQEENEEDSADSDDDKDEEDKEESQEKNKRKKKDDKSDFESDDDSARRNKKKQKRHTDHDNNSKTSSEYRKKKYSKSGRVSDDEYDSDLSINDKNIEKKRIEELIKKYNIQPCIINLQNCVKEDTEEKKCYSEKNGTPLFLRYFNLKRSFDDESTTDEEKIEIRKNKKEIRRKSKQIQSEIEKKYEESKKRRSFEVQVQIEKVPRGVIESSKEEMENPNNEGSKQDDGNVEKNRNVKEDVNQIYQDQKNKRIEKRNRNRFENQTVFNNNNMYTKLKSVVPSDSDDVENSPRNQNTETQKSSIQPSKSNQEYQNSIITSTTEPSIVIENETFNANNIKDNDDSTESSCSANVTSSIDGENIESTKIVKESGNTADKPLTNDHLEERICDPNIESDTKRRKTIDDNEKYKLNKNNLPDIKEKHLENDSCNEEIKTTGSSQNNEAVLKENIINENDDLLKTTQSKLSKEGTLTITEEMESNAENLKRMKILERFKRNCDFENDEERNEIDQIIQTIQNDCRIEIKIIGNISQYLKQTVEESASDVDREMSETHDDDLTEDNLNKHDQKSKNESKRSHVSSDEKERLVRKKRKDTSDTSCDSDGGTNKLYSKKNSSSSDSDRKRKRLKRKKSKTENESSDTDASISKPKKKIQKLSSKDTKDSNSSDEVKRTNKTSKNTEKRSESDESYSDEETGLPRKKRNKKIKESESEEEEITRKLGSKKTNEQSESDESYSDEGTGLPRKKNNKYKESESEEEEEEEEEDLKKPATDDSNDSDYNPYEDAVAIRLERKMKKKKNRSRSRGFKETQNSRGFTNASSRRRSLGNQNQQSHNSSRPNWNTLHTSGKRMPQPNSHSSNSNVFRPSMKLSGVTITPSIKTHISKDTPTPLNHLKGITVIKSNAASSQSSSVGHQPFKPKLGPASSKLGQPIIQMGPMSRGGLPSSNVGQSYVQMGPSARVEMASSKVGQSYYAQMGSYPRVGPVSSKVGQSYVQMGSSSRVGPASSKVGQSYVQMGSSSRVGPASSKVGQSFVQMGPTSRVRPESSNTNINWERLNRSSSITIHPKQNAPKTFETQNSSKKLIQGGFQVQKDSIRAKQDGGISSLTKEQVINSRQCIAGSRHEQQIRMKHVINKDDKSGAGQDQRITSNVQKTIRPDGRQVIRKVKKTVTTNVEVEEFVLGENEVIDIDD